MTVLHQVVPVHCDPGKKGTRTLTYHLNPLYWSYHYKGEESINLTFLQVLGTPSCVASTRSLIEVQHIMQILLMEKLHHFGHSSYYSIFLQCIMV